MSDALLSELASVCARQGFPLSADQIRQFVSFHEALYAWNATKNLTRVPPESCELRHFCESCLILELIKGQDVLDVGTGPGFPAWPLACARPELRVTALDSNRKMLDFLETQSLANLTIQVARMEDTGWSEQFDTVTGRALAPLPIQLEVSAQACRVGGRIVPFRTANDHLEPSALEVLGLRLLSVEVRDLGDGMTRVFPVYEKIRPTPREHPRQWAAIKQKPLD